MAYLRRVIQITAEDSPNVQRARQQLARGLQPDDEIVVPGVLSWSEYQERLRDWDEVMQCVGLRGEFYKGAQVLLYPAEWLNAAHERHRALSRRGVRRHAKSIGCDPGEGVADTVWAAVDEHGLMDLCAVKTADTSLTYNLTLAFMKKHGLAGDDVIFDAGGGGRQIADFLRAAGHRVRTVGFGESVTPEKSVIRRRVPRVRHDEEDRAIYKNRRAQMYGEPRDRLNPSADNRSGPLLAIPGPDCGPLYAELRRQMAVMPLMRDGEGKLFLPPKNRKDPDSDEVTLSSIIGRSPDHADAFVLALHGLWHKKTVKKVGAWGAR